MKTQAHKPLPQDAAAVSLAGERCASAVLGPTAAAPDYPMYFLNVLAGPAEDRTMAFCDDPAHHWIRESWNTQTQDPRLPWTTAAGRTEKS